MSVIVSNGNVNLSTANGFYRAEAYNLTSLSTTQVVFTRTISVTFANAGNCQGLILSLGTSSFSAFSTFKDAVVTLQENVASVWTDRATVTLTAAQISNSSSSIPYGTSWIVPFTGGTFPYAVTTAASTWRFNLTLGAGTNSWVLATSDATNPFYVTWCDNAVTFADNDSVVCKDVVTVDQTATFRGVLGTGTAVDAAALIICKSTTPTPASVSNLVWSNPPAAAYTLSIDGYAIISGHGGFRVGTSAAPIPLAQAATVSFISPTVGTTTGFKYTAISNINAYKTSLFMYGAVHSYNMTRSLYDVAIGGTATMTIASPCVVTKAGHLFAASTPVPVQFTTTGALPTGVTASTTYYALYVSSSTFNLYDTYANALAGGATGRVDTSGSQSGTHTLNSVLITTDTTGWTVGDGIVVCKQNVKGSGTYDITNTIATISGTTITFTTNLATYVRKAGGPVFNLNTYAVKMLGYGTVVNVGNRFHTPNNFVLSGVLIKNCLFTMAAAGTAWLTDSGNQSQLVIENCLAYSSTATTGIFINSLTPPVGNALINKVYCIGMVVSGVTSHSVSGWAGFGQAGGSLTITNCIQQSSSTSMWYANGVNTTFTGNEAYNHAGNGVSQAAISYGASAPGLINATVQNNIVYGTNSNAINLFNFIPATWSGDKYNNSTAVLRAFGYVSAILTNGIFGNESANTADLDFLSDILVDIEIASPTGTLTVTTTNLPLSVVGTHARISDSNDTANVDLGYLKYGYYVRTGTGLSDTTARTAGGYALRLQPTDGSNTLNWPNLVKARTIPTGNIQNLTMTITCWVYINNTAYDAGTYQLPRLNVKYDNTTTTYTEATATFGSWQQLAVTFTPTTTYGQIEVWVSGATDATGSNAYFYIDDFNVAYPAGVSINLGSLDLWANATPIWPPIANNPSLGGVWDEATTAHTVSGSFGAKVKKALELGQFIALK